jgi:periplasmic divalent cation tolerance protein
MSMILIYTTCENVEHAKSLSKTLLQKRLCACVNIIPQMYSLYFWPPKEGKIEESNEVVLLIKTVKEKFNEVERVIKANHSFEMPAIFSMPIDQVNKDYLTWIKNEVIKKIKG